MALGYFRPVDEKGDLCIYWYVLIANYCLSSTKGLVIVVVKSYILLVCMFLFHSTLDERCFNVRHLEVLMVTSPERQLPQNG